MKKGFFTPNIIYGKSESVSLEFFIKHKNRGIVKCSRRIVVVYSTHSLYIHIKQLCKVFTPHEKTLEFYQSSYFWHFFLILLLHSSEKVIASRTFLSQK